jgi:CubicO group peptidase (beta-lactamase class C family)
MHDGESKRLYFISAKPESVGFSSDRLARLDTFLQQAIDRGDLPNAVTFIARKGKVIHYKAYGFRNIEKQIPLKTTDIFRIASQSKAVTTVALMTLYEEGKFGLDEPVSKYIQAFKDPMVIETLILPILIRVRPQKRDLHPPVVESYRRYPYVTLFT